MLDKEQSAPLSGANGSLRQALSAEHSWLVSARSNVFCWVLSFPFARMVDLAHTQAGESEW
jgi:hypothetical protein